MIRFLLVCIAAVLLAACGTFGHASYTVKAVEGGGCELAVADGKEFEGRRIQFDGRACQLGLIEGQSKAFPGQAIGAKAMTILPVTGLDDLLPAAK